MSNNTSVDVDVDVVSDVDVDMSVAIANSYSADKDTIYNKMLEIRKKYSLSRQGLGEEDAKNCFREIAEFVVDSMLDHYKPLPNTKPLSLVNYHKLDPTLRRDYDERNPKWNDRPEINNYHAVKLANKSKRFFLEGLIKDLNEDSLRINKLKNYIRLYDVPVQEERDEKLNSVLTMFGGRQK